MIFRQVLHEDLGCASYLVGDESAGVAAVVDPRLDVTPYLDLARYMGVRIDHVFETHNHADHVSGHGALVAATGATLHVHRLAGAAYPHEPFDDGDSWSLGTLTIRAWHTPGHRPEHTVFVLTDTHRSSEPWALLSGDTLFVNDIARPDLAVDGAEGARGIFRALHEQLLTLPDTVEVWPGHLGGSLCGGPGMDLKICSTIGFERAHNAALAIDDEERFVEAALEGLGAKPPNFEAIVELNTGPLHSRAVTVPALGADETAERQREGALLVDVRPDAAFDAAHIPGAISLPTSRAGFGSKLAWVAGPERELIFVGQDEHDSLTAGELAASVGLPAVGGRLAEGLTAWIAAGRSVVATERLPVSDLPARWERDPQLQVLDVRDPHEWEAGHLAGSVLRTWRDLDELPSQLDPNRPIAVICASGERAATAASLLEHHGAARVIHVVDGGVPRLGALGISLEQGCSPSRSAS